MSRIQNAECRLFKPGHGTHYIHARQHSRDRSHHRVTLVDHDVAQHRLVLVTENELIVARHHDIVRVVQNARGGAELRIDLRWHILRVDNYLANVAIDEPYEPCVAAQRPADTSR